MFVVVHVVVFVVVLIVLVVFTGDIVVVGPRNLNLKFCQNHVSNSRDIVELQS